MKDATHRYKNSLLLLLMVILASNYVDRLALGILLQDIKTDLQLTDTQLGVLSGIAFAFFYAVMGLPIARWADRGNRVTIIALTTGLWSMAVALCGAATSFLQLLLIRVGVAVGEAGCVPPAHSLIADVFPRTERPRAVARYLVGWPLSVVIGYFLAGWLNEFYGWRMTFLLLGLPGLGLAALAWFTLREPRRVKPAADSRVAASLASLAEAAQPEAATFASAPPSLKAVGVTLWANHTFRHLLLCLSVSYFFAYGIRQWTPAFFIRSYGFETGELGSWMAAIDGVGAFLGLYLGGELAARYAAQNERLQLKAMAVMWCSFGVLESFVYLAPTYYLAFAAMGLAMMGVNTTSGPLFALIQTLVPERMRATSIALVYLCANLIGMGLGPLVAGALSDALRPELGEDSLRYALLALCPGYLWCGWHLWRASRTAARDLEAAQAAEDARLAPAPPPVAVAEYGGAR